MGITNLWEAVAPVAKTCSLLELTVTHLFNPDGSRCSEHPFRIGIDASLWMAQCQHSFRHGHAQCGPNPELRTLLYKLAHLCCTPANILLVFDGPEKLPLKRGKKVVSTPPWLTEPFKRFASAFGFETHVAAGEAEAELAAFNCQGLIDAVWTEDSDALVFGAQTVFRRQACVYDHNNKEGIVVYSATDILLDSRVTLTKGGLLLMALFCGGDYDKGLPHCGWKTTRSLAQQGVGDELLHAAETMNKEDLTKFIGCWVKHVRDLLAEMGQENKRYRMLSENFPENFPSPAIVLAYVKPATTDVGHASAHIPLPLSCPMSADLEQLAFLCEFHFGWSRGGPPVPVHAIESSGTLGKLQRLVWEGMCIRALCEVSARSCPSSSMQPAQTS
ncbi:PIN domain-like protein [Melanogaster broomeanus]|nr:PIN domain-like protein [Melanogaster broomeanus]